MKNQAYHGNKVLKRIPEENGITYIVKDGSKLSEVFPLLPSGIVNKTETGIGATTLELQSPRNSIIVEPIKVTASHKASSQTVYLSNHPDPQFAALGAIYVGSETKHHSKKLTEADIQLYHRTPGYKKILVVADGLRKVIKAIGPAVYH